MTGTCNRFRSPRRRPVPAFRRIRMHRLPSGTPADSAATTAGASDLKNPRRWRSQRNGSGVVRIGRAGPAGYSEPSTNASAVLDMGPSLLILAIAPADLRQLPRKTKGSVQIRRRNGGQKNRLNPRLVPTRCWSEKANHDQVSVGSHGIHLQRFQTNLGTHGGRVPTNVNPLHKTQVHLQKGGVVHKKNYAGSCLIRRHGPAHAVVGDACQSGFRGGSIPSLRRDSPKRKPGR